MKKHLFFVLLIVSCFLLTGCWNYREINLLSIVAGMGIDRDPETGNYLFSIEIVETGANTIEQAPTSKLIETKGETVFDGIRNAIAISGKRLFWSHAQTIVVSEDVAKQGILEVIDFFYRDAEPRLTLHLVVACGTSAKDIISSEGVTNKIRSYEIDDKLENISSIQKYPNNRLYEIVEMLKFDVPYAFTPSISINKQRDKEVSEIYGTAVFKGDKLAGFLDQDESKYFLFIVNEIKGGLLVNKSAQNNPNANICLEIFKNTTTIKPEYNNGIITMTIRTVTETAIGESGPKVNFSDKPGLTALKKDMQEFLLRNIVRVIQKVQNEFDADIFGFGPIIAEDLPDVWKQYKDNWAAEFKELGFKISCEIDIKNTALSGKSLEGAV